MKRKKASLTASQPSVGLVSRLMSNLRSPSKNEPDVPAAVQVPRPTSGCTAGCCPDTSGTAALAARSAQMREALQGMDVDAPPPPPAPPKPPSRALVSVTSSRDVPVKTSSRVQMIKLEHSGAMVPAAQLAEIKSKQRGPRGLWGSEWAFPGQLHGPGHTHDIFDREALERPKAWNCHGVCGCLRGDCAAQLTSADVVRLRQELVVRCEGLPGQATLKPWQVVQSDLLSSYDRTSETWNRTIVALDQYTSISMCPSAFGLLMGITGPTFYDKVLTPIRDGTAVRLGSGTGAKRIMSREDHAKQRGLETAMLASYVRDLVNQHEQQPAPGAAGQRGVTVISKTSWKEKWAACCRYFESAGKDAPPGSQSMLKRVWKVSHSVSSCFAGCVTVSDVSSCVRCVRRRRKSDCVRRR